MGTNPTALSVRIAAKVHTVANTILAADFAQTVMVLVTVAAATTYGWIEGYMIRANLGDQKNFPVGTYFGISSYHIAFGLILGLITGGFALIKARNMFARGNRYFLFAFIGNYPLSWLVEDFAYFLFNPLDTLTANLHRDNFGLGAVWVYGPWLPGTPKAMFPIPTWYFIAFAWFVGCQWYAHRCTVYDATIKDELGQTLQLSKALPTPLPTPLPSRFQFLYKRLRGPPEVSTPPAAEPVADQHGPAHPSRVPTRRTPKAEPSQNPKTPVTPTVKELIERRDRSLEVQPPTRSPAAEAALKRLREKWIRK